MVEEFGGVKLGEHDWVVAATIPVNNRDAAYGNRRGIYRVPVDTKVSVMETYCDTCRKPYDEVKNLPCAISPWVRHGGPIGTRKPRRRTGTGGALFQPQCPSCKVPLVYTGEKTPAREFRPMICPKCGEVYR